MKCPKCEAEIARFDLSPNCKKCGVHIMYYTQEEDLRRDAKKTELEFATARLLVAKIRASYFKGKAEILRIVFFFLSVASLLLPVFTVKLSFPWWDYEISVGALGIYNIITDSLWTMLNAFTDIGVGKVLFLITVTALALLVLTALCLIGSAAAWLFSAASIRKSAKAAIAFSAPAILFGIGSTVLSFIAVNLSGAIEFVTVKPMFGGVLTVIFISAFIASNAALIMNTPEIVVKAADRKRLEIKAMLKKGEITLDELPLPIVEDEPEEQKSKKKRGKKK